MYLRSEEVKTGQQLSWLEHTTDNREVDGSSPFWPTTSKNYGGLAQLGERLPCKQEVSGSIPLISTNLKRVKKKLTEVPQQRNFIEFLEKNSGCTLKTEHCDY